MRRGPLIVCTLGIGVLVTAAALDASPPRVTGSNRPVAVQAPVTRNPAKAANRAIRKAPPVAAVTAAAMEPRIAARPRTLVRPAPVLNRSGGAAGVAPGTTVYKNEIAGPSQVYTPGTGQPIADDLQIAGGTGCDLVFYEISVFGFNASGQDRETVDIQTVLFDGDPCEAGASAIAGTEGQFTVPNDGSGWSLPVQPTAPIPIPDSVWLQVTFSRDDVGWLIAEQAEIGATSDFWSEDDDKNTCDEVDPNCEPDYTCTSGVCQACSLFFFNGDPYAGFSATLNCNLTTEPNGACCNGSSCTEVTEADCIGAWQGAFSTCDPNPCLTGACCTGSGFQTCAETSEATCFEGLFRPGSTCDLDPCGPTHLGFANTFNTGSFSGIDTRTKWADDMRFSTTPAAAGAVGTQCELAGYGILVTGDGTLGPDQFDATIELWTNDDNGTPDELDDAPLNPIAGTAKTFRNVRADFFAHLLLAGAFEGIVLPEKVWIVLTTTSDFAGPLLGGPAKLGASLDAFAIFNDEWVGGFWFGGFNSNGCPTEKTCNPAGSFRAAIICANERPTGACCDDGTGTCTDGLTSLECGGRFAPDQACDSAPFNPPCGTNGCCFPNLINPSTPDCLNLSIEDCRDRNGAVAAGLACGEFTCPRVDCIGRTGDCSTDNARPGCEDAFCCEQVCSGDDFCCSNRWDGGCADRAELFCEVPPPNDDLADAQPIPGPIAGQGTFTFDNTLATTDGPDNAGCAGIDNITGITDDVWFCWTPPCTDTAIIKTCDLTDVDTKLAIYEDCTRPPSDATLIACNDDFCNFQSQVTFQAFTGQTYLIRLGGFPGMAEGAGSFSVRCGPLNNTACTGGTVDCCVGTEPGTFSPSCSNETCCEWVCECDSYCCDTDWDDVCAGAGLNGNGCGAAVLCSNLCGTCPVGPITCLDPPDGVVDAGYPLDPGTGEPLGIQTITLRAPHGAHEGCWRLCDTNQASSNTIASVVEDMGIYTITLEQPITPNAVTTITYTDALGDENTCSFTSHSGNVDGDDVADGRDLSILPQIFAGSVAAPWGSFSTDLDRDGTFHPADIMAQIDMLLGVGLLEPAMDTPKPSAEGICP